MQVTESFQDNEALELVAAGAAWLDVRYPGWAEKVDPDTLKMSQAARCIGGQIGVFWMTLDYQFQQDTGRPSGDLFAAYDREWCAAIAVRQTS